MPIIAIDGPGGAGKSTVAAALAQRLGLERLDTGAMYRAVTLLVVRGGVDPSDDDALAKLARTSDIEVTDRVLLDGEDVSEAIRSDVVNTMVSLVSAHPDLRAELVERQRAWVRTHGGGVVEGRDITSVVLPDADVKVYLTAHPDERARRRAGEMASEERPVDEEVAAAKVSIARRDALDSSRAASPLVVADGAVVIDTTDRSVEDVVEEIVSLL